MSIPTYEVFMLPLLRAIADGENHQIRDLYSRLADVMSIPADERAKLLPSGQQRVVPNRIGWARTYLKKAGLLESPKRGLIKITDRGREILSTNPSQVDYKYLERFDNFKEWRRATPKPDTASTDEEVDTTTTPEEAIAVAYEQMRDEVASQLLDALKECDPYQFETVVLRLLQGMGYGISGSGAVTPRSRDGGIDGIIHEDKLGLDSVCIQAKRWDGTVPRRVVQEFVGSMDLYRSRKGVILTTSRFSADALDYVQRIEAKKVVLIDGDQLCRLMMGHRIGVTVRQVYEIVDVSQDFFDAET